MEFPYDFWKLLDAAYMLHVEQIEGVASFRISQIDRHLPRGGFRNKLRKFLPRVRTWQELRDQMEGVRQNDRDVTPEVLAWMRSEVPEFNCGPVEYVAAPRRVRSWSMNARRWKYATPTIVYRREGSHQLEETLRLKVPGNVGIDPEVLRQLIGKNFRGDIPMNVHDEQLLVTYIAFSTSLTERVPDVITEASLAQIEQLELTRVHRSVHVRRTEG